MSLRTMFWFLRRGLPFTMQRFSSSSMKCGYLQPSAMALTIILAWLSVTCRVSAISYRYLTLARDNHNKKIS